METKCGKFSKYNLTNSYDWQYLTLLPLSNHTSVEGFIMDQYCINLGYLLDNPSVITLENPAAHSIHWYVSLIVLFFLYWTRGCDQYFHLSLSFCSIFIRDSLLDVSVCVASDYVVLLNPGSTTVPTIPLATIAPTIAPTGPPTTQPPTFPPTKAPTVSFAELFARLVQPSQVPSAAPTSNDDDFFSILNRTYGKVESTTPVNVETTASVNAPSLYTAGYVLDDFGKQRITEIGRSVGICSTCGGSGTIRNGLRAEVRGIVSEVSTTNGPHKLAVSSVQVSNNLTSICQAPSGSTAATSPSQSPNLRPSRTSGLFERVRSVFDSLFAFLA